MASSRSFRFREHEKHLDSGAPRQRCRSSSQHLSNRRPGVSGVLKASEAVQIFSRSGGAWVAGFITEVRDDNLVWVEYKVGEDWHGKVLHIFSEHLASASTMDDSDVEHDLSTEDDPLLQEHDPGFFRLLPQQRREKWLTAGELLLGMEVERGTSFIDMNEPNNRWNITGKHIIEVEDSTKSSGNLYRLGGAKVNIRLSKVIDVDENIPKESCTIKSHEGRVLRDKVDVSLCAALDAESLIADGEIDASLSRELGDGVGKLSFEISAPLLRIALKKHDPPSDPSTYISSAILGCKCEGEVLVHGGAGIKGGIGIKAKASQDSVKAKTGAQFWQRKSPNGYHINIQTLGGPAIPVEHDGKTMQEVLAYLQRKWLTQARKKPETWKVLEIGVRTDNHTPVRGRQDLTTEMTEAKVTEENSQKEAQLYKESSIISASNWSASEFQENLERMQMSLPRGHCLIGHLTSKSCLHGIIGPGNFGLRATKRRIYEYEVPLVFVIRHVSKLGWEQYGRHPFPERAGKALWSPGWRRRLPPDCDLKLQCLILFSVPEQIVKSQDESHLTSVHVSCIYQDDLKQCRDGHFYLTQDHILQVYDLEPQKGFAEPCLKVYRERLVKKEELPACDWPFIVSTGKMDKYIFVGNPGVGKSTLLNGLVGRNEHGQVRFKSGVSYGKGLTTVLQTELVRGVCWMDVPGLADVEFCRQAAKEISQAFKQGGHFHVVFVVVLQNGRVRADDKATMLTVLEAVPELTWFGIVFNNLSKREKKELEEAGDHWDRVQAALACDSPRLMSNQVFFNTHDIDLHGVDDAVPELPIEFHNFISGMIGNEVTTERVADINVDKFREMVTELKSTLEEMRRNEVLMQAALKAAEEQQAKLHKEHQQALEIAEKRAAERLEAEMKLCQAKHESDQVLLRADLERIQADMATKLKEKEEAFERYQKELEAKLKLESDEKIQQQLEHSLRELSHKHAQQIETIRREAKNESAQRCVRAVRHLDGGCIDPPSDYD